MEQKGTAMLANYIIKMKLDNGDLFTIGVMVGILVGVGLVLFLERGQSQ